MTGGVKSHELALTEGQSTYWLTSLLLRCIFESKRPQKDSVADVNHREVYGEKHRELAEYGVVSGAKDTCTRITPYRVHVNRDER